MRAVDKVTPAIEDKLAKLGLELYELKYFRAGKRSVLRVFIDKPGGVTIDDCENASNELSMVLDVEGFSNRSYTLEVSSPGLDRPLTEERDFRRACGHDVALRLLEPLDGKRRVTGKLMECENEVLRLKKGDEIIPVPLSNVQTGRVEISFK